MAGKPDPKRRTGYSGAADDPGLPLDVLFRSVEIKANAAGIKARGAARELLTAARNAHEGLIGDDDLARTLLEAAQDLLEEMDRWKDAHASVTVDRDKRVREVMAEALSCQHHGDMIRGLNEQLADVDASRDRSEKARLVLLGLLFALRRFLTATKNSGVAIPDAKKIIAWLTTAEKQATAAHDRAWRPRPSTADRKKD